ncbi:peptidase M4 family protein [Pseudoxanthomonas yeongjuensis]|uniref:M4 family metallopeptidase n=1 Tax=Pseudoxanthomonas yeongjuensis TaxID=377616 RepID=UPI001391516B|nr:M4 family metallopeptidase [Pseudoxanthomonas yeongjuensis]KAF1716361.1 peptidase M4 family protein [Pseudoxanthomonas yeongjuensis]
MSFNPKILSLAVLMALTGNTVAAELDSATIASKQLALQKSPAVGRALGLLGTSKGISTARVSQNDRFIARDVTVDRDGTEHVRFNRTYAGLPVIGGDFVVHSRNGQLKAASQTQRSALSLSTRARVAATDAIVSAGVEFGSGFVGRPTASLAVYARDENAPKLAWQVAFVGFDKTGGAIDSVYIVDANNGKVLDRWSTIETTRVRGAVCLSTDNTPATGTGKTLYSGNVAIGTTACGTSFDLKDQSRGRNYVTDLGNAAVGKGKIFNDLDNVFGNNADTDRASAAVDALYGAERTWDYYRDVHGRLGINNDGVGALNRVHAGQGYANANWSDACFCMTYGDGDGVNIGPLVALDIAGHEISHGVTSRTARLIYSGESGALNEANSDILGTMVEFRANNPLDTPDYLIGEKIFISNPGNTKALRWMFKPDLDGLSPNCYSSNIGKLDVHFSSGVANHFYYLLAEGSGSKTFSGVNHTSPTCNGSSLAGITRAKAEKIWYRALTVYFTSNTGYAAARAATISASNDLYGVNSIESKAVAATWSAVKVN